MDYLDLGRGWILVGGDKINKAKLADGWEEKDGEGKEKEAGSIEENNEKEKSRDKRKRSIGFISYIFQHDRSAVTLQNISFQNVIRLSSF